METKLEQILINSHKAALISFIRSHPENFNELVKLSISDKGRYSWRAAWLLWSCMSPNDSRIRKYVNKIIELLPTKLDSQQRELLMVLQRMELNEDQEGRLYEICTKIWEKTSKNPSLRYNAYKLMLRISKKHPELLKETLYFASPIFIDSLSAGVKKSILRLVKDL